MTYTLDYPPLWCATINSSFVQRNVVYYTVCSNKSGSLLSFLRQQQRQEYVCHQPAPNSPNTERYKGETQEQKYTKVQRYWKETQAKPTNIPWMQLSVWGIMWGRWSMILIRSLFAFLIITSMCWRSAACFIYSCEWEQTADLLTFCKMSPRRKL